MPRLILMRHAKSDWSEEGLEDFDRGLNPRGVRSAKALGDWLRAEGYLPDEVLCSSATRARLTYDGLALDPKKPPNFLRGLYMAGPEEMLRILHAASGRCVLMIGHNDGIGAFAAGLVAQAPDHPRFAAYPTGATLVADLAAPDWQAVTWRTARPVAFVVPRELD